MLIYLSLYNAFVNSKAMNLHNRIGGFRNSKAAMCIELNIVDTIL